MVKHHPAGIDVSLCKGRDHHARSSREFKLAIENRGYRGDETTASIFLELPAQCSHSTRRDIADLVQLNVSNLHHPG